MDALEPHLNRQIERSERFFWNRLRWELIAGHLPDREPFELVDVGAGAGFLGLYLARNRPLCRYRFVEPIASIESNLITRFGGDANARSLGAYEGAQYVTALDVLEHQEDDRAFLGELSTKMPSGANLLITVPAAPKLWSAWDEALGHHRRYTRGTLGAAVRELPFEIVEISYLFPELVPLAWVRRVRRPGGSGVHGGSAEFPDLPELLNEGLYAIGKLSLRMRRRWPIGTSLFAALQRR